MADKINALGKSDESDSDQDEGDQEQPVPQHRHLPTRLYKTTGGVVIDSSDEDDFEVPMQPEKSQDLEEGENTPHTAGSKEVRSSLLHCSDSIPLFLVSVLPG
jgi:hypothetical protein